MHSDFIVKGIILFEQQRMGGGVGWSERDGGKCKWHAV